MKKFLASAATAVILAGSATVVTTAVAAPADAAGNKTPGCITKAEFRKIRSGMTITKARKIIGGKGKLQSSLVFPDGDERRSYNFKQCGRSYRTSFALIQFKSTETSVYVPNNICFPNGDGSQTCTDVGTNESRYGAPLIVDSKAAFF